MSFLTQFAQSGWAASPGTAEYAMNFFVLVYWYGTFVPTFRSPQPQLSRNPSHIHTFPDHIIHAQFSVPHKMVQPFALLYAGQGGKDHHTKTRYFYKCIPFLATVTSISGSSQVAKAPTVTQKKKEARRKLLLQSSTRRRVNPSECFLSHHKYLKLSTSWH